jgi:hypothetical protein
MAKPLSAQTIFEQKSSELADSLAAADAAGKRLSDAMDEEAEALPPLTTCPIALALRGEDRDYSRVEGVLETKLSGKPPAGIQGMKERLEEQKLVIKDLRAVGKTLLSRCGEAEQVAAAFIAQHETAAAKVEAERDTLLSERDAANAHMAALGLEKDDVEKRLNSALASFAAVDEQRRAGLEERDSARAQLALKTAAEESCRQELRQATADLAASKLATEQLRNTLETRQMTMDKEMNDLRESLGREMVAVHEANSKLTAAQEDLTGLRTKVAVAEESLKLAKSEQERLEAEKTSKAQELQTSERDRAALGVRLEEMQRSLDVRDSRHTEAMRSLAVGQEMQAARVKELGEEKEAVIAATAKLRAEWDALQAELSKCKGSEHELRTELRIKDSQLERANADVEAKAAECLGLKAELLAKEEARQSSAAAVAVLEAECNVYRQHAQQALPDKIRELFETKMAADKECADRAAAAHLQLAVAHMANVEMEGHSALCDKLRAEVCDLKARLQKSEGARRKLHNLNQELRGNIRTFVRVRPAREDGSEGQCPVVVEDDGAGGDGGKLMLVHNAKPEAFRFDRCFPQGSSQEEVFGEVEHFVQSALDGYNVSLLAYGQTGAGKTWSMMGGHGASEEGIIPRSIRQILCTVADMEASGWVYELEGSFLEIYNESVRDLLTTDKEAEGKQYNIRPGDTGSGCMLVGDLTR